MKFFVKDYSNKYKELIITDAGATLESGLMNDDERRNLAEELQSAIDDLLCGLKAADDESGRQ